MIITLDVSLLVYLKAIHEQAILSPNMTFRMGCNNWRVRKAGASMHAVFL